ncbi:MAG: hypothetical protein AB7K67_00900 [Hyphomicrobiaceae bacterium]
MAKIPVEILIDAPVYVSPVSTKTYPKGWRGALDESIAREMIDKGFAKSSAAGLFVAPTDSAAVEPVSPMAPGDSADAEPVSSVAPTDSADADPAGGRVDGGGDANEASTVQPTDVATPATRTRRRAARAAQA